MTEARELIDKLHEEYCNSLIVHTTIDEFDRGLIASKEEALIHMVKQFYKTNKFLLEEYTDLKRKHG